MADQTDAYATGRSTRHRLHEVPSAGHLVLALGVCLLLIFVGAASALADSSEPPPGSVPTSEEVTQAIESEGSGSIAREITNPSAAEGVARQNLGRSEALELMNGVFEAQLQSPAGIFDDLHVEKFLSDNVAVIAAGEQPEPLGPPVGEEPASGLYEGATLMDSTVPLRAEGPAGEEEAVNLGLEHSEGELQPANPLVDVGVPQQLGEGIDLAGPGVQIELAEAPEERSPSTVDDSVAVYPNVATDTDFVVAPTLTGVETLTQMRSPESPRSETFNLSLPAGSVLQGTKDGGAEVKDGEETIVDIAPPTAIDATGAAVPVSLEVAGSSLTLTVAPDESTAYPILLDPLFQTYEWSKMPSNKSGICNSSIEVINGNSCNNREEWGYEHIDYQAPPFHIEVAGQIPSPGGNGPVGLYIASSGTAISGDRGTILYTVPRYFKESPQPTSFIGHLTLSSLQWTANSAHLSPYLFAGIWDSIKPGWVSYYSHEGLSGHSLNDMAWQYQFTNPGPNTNAKVAEVSVNVTETQPSSNANVYVGAATVELGDSDLPGIGSISGPSEWVNQTAPPISFTASDSGLGMFAMTANTEQLGSNGQPLHSWKASYGCLGVADAACPRTWKSSEAGHPSLQYEPALLPTGIDYLKVIAEDPVGNKSSPASVQVKVDHAAPSIALSGAMNEQAKLGTMLSSYPLKLTATDGTSEKPQSGVVKAVVKVDGTVVDEAAPGCTTQNCAITREWTLKASEYAAGQHTVEVIATDAVGLVTTKKLTIALNNDRVAPTLTLTGSMTEQASLGTSRPRYTLKLKASDVTEAEGVPRAMTAFGSEGYEGAQFLEPIDVATDTKGNLWVVDHFSFLGGVKEFNEKTEYLRQFGGYGSGIGELKEPTAIAADSKGNVWVADTGNNRIVEFSEKGAYIAKFGSYGSGNGQFQSPSGIAIDSKGNIWVADREGNRVEKFNEKGEYVSKLGSYGTGNGQLIGPTAITTDSKGNIWVVDAGNNRVQKFNEKLEYVGKFGSYGSGNGQFASPAGIDIDSKSNVFVVDRGHNRVQKFNEKLEYVTQFGTAGSGIGQFGSPQGMAIDSKGNIWVVDANNFRVQRWSRIIPPSGIASTEITVDGTKVDSTTTGCTTEGCSVSREWNLESGAYSVGKHTVVGKTIDGVGNMTTKTLTIEVQRDTTKPTLEATGALVEAPEGWVEQHNYSLTGKAQDAGYGVTQMKLMIDGAQADIATQTCLNGGCSLSHTFSVDTTTYSGGAHEAELIVTDGTGNATTKKWTINVDPEGHISAEEATATLEAVDATSPVNTVGEAQEEEEYEGTVPGLGIQKVNGDFEATGTQVPTTVAEKPSGGITMEVLEDGAFAVPCEEKSSSSEEALKRAEEAEKVEKAEEASEEYEEQEPCKTRSELEKEAEEAAGEYSNLEPTQVTPVSTGGGATENEIAGAAAAVAANTASHVDTIVRPLYEGAMTFEAIRDTSAPETYSWEVHLEPKQELKLIDDRHAEVYYEGGHPAFGISAEPASDAVGTTVPTKLSVSEGKIVTLRIEHHAATYVYPVVAGAGWQGGFTTEVVQGPKDERELREERERIEREEREAREAEENGEESVATIDESGANLVVNLAAIGPPVADASADGDPGSIPIRVFTMTHKFKFNQCRYSLHFEAPEPPPEIPPEWRREAADKCRQQIESPTHIHLIAGMAVHGWYHDNQRSNWVWISKGNLQCDKWGPDQPAMVHCEKRPLQPSHENVHLLGDYRFAPGKGGFSSVSIVSACDTVRGRLEVGPTYHQEEPITSSARAAYGNEPAEPCSWP